MNGPLGTQWLQCVYLNRIYLWIFLLNGNFKFLCKVDIWVQCGFYTSSSSELIDVALRPMRVVNYMGCLLGVFVMYICQCGLVLYWIWLSDMSMGEWKPRGQ